VSGGPLGGGPPSPEAGEKWLVIGDE
jgi:hypothetical protein